MQDPVIKKLGGQSKTGRYKQHDEMDAWLDSNGFYRKHTARDATCLYRAIAEQIFLTQAVHTDVKRQILDFIARQPKLFEELIEKDDVAYYVDKMRIMRDWGGLTEIYAAAMLYKSKVLIWHEVGTEPTEIGLNPLQINCPLKGVIYNEKSIQLCQSHEKHYDSVFTKQYISNSAFCQSLIYETLYKKVFKLEEVDYAVDKMLHDKGSKSNADGTPSSVYPVQHHGCEDLKLEMRDCILNVKDLLDVGVIPFPYKVAKSLDREVYRNVEYDVWNDYRKGLRFGLFEWSCKELQVGVKCLVHLEGDRKCLGHIQEMSPNRGPVVVFVVELGQKISVPYENLELLPPSQETKPQLQPARPSSLALSTILNLNDHHGEGNQESSSPHQVTSSGCYDDNDEPMHVANGHYLDSAEGEVLPDSSTGKVLYIMYPNSPRVPVGLVREPEQHSNPPELPMHYPVLPMPPVEGVRVNAVGTGNGYNGYLFGGGYLVPPFELAPPSYETVSPLTPVTPISAIHPSALETVIQPEPAEPPESRELMRPEMLPGPPIMSPMIPPGRVVMPRAAREVYEGQPLIQQYEVSSSSGNGGRGRLPLAPLPTPIAPSPVMPVYYQPVDLCDHHYYPPPIYVDHFLVNRYPQSYPPTHTFPFPPPEHVYYQTAPSNPPPNL